MWVSESRVLPCRFYWHELMLWPKDIPEHAVVALSANDDLVPAELVQVRCPRTVHVLTQGLGLGHRQLPWTFCQRASTVALLSSHLACFSHRRLMCVRAIIRTAGCMVQRRTPFVGSLCSVVFRHRR